ncbi:hypothetical protein BKA70DRAFT_1483752 [Coprinopsis sp. MPI-PUGE-AT-0042]|nr:hypothetical protein BKA70DRAFT_1483752 [Coprinopsis sp. MPI-PUGE-AT-0042]
MTFWDRETGEIARRIDVDAKVLDSGATITNKGVEEALNIVAETPDGVKTSRWVGDCFIGTSSSNRLCYSWLSMPVPSNSEQCEIAFPNTLATRLPRRPRHASLLPYPLPLRRRVSTTVLRGDTEAAQESPKGATKSQANKVVELLERRGILFHVTFVIWIDSGIDHRKDLACIMTIITMAPSLVDRIYLWALRVAIVRQACGAMILCGTRFDAAAYAKFQPGSASYRRRAEATSRSLWSIDQRYERWRGYHSITSPKGGKHFRAFWHIHHHNTCYTAFDEATGTREASGRMRITDVLTSTLTVKAWEAELEHQQRRKIAESIADPDAHPDWLEEGWADASKHAEVPAYRFPNSDIFRKR